MIRRCAETGRADEVLARGTVRRRRCRRAGKGDDRVAGHRAGDEVVDLVAVVRDQMMRCRRLAPPCRR
jgi:hypothetical protein